MASRAPRILIPLGFLVVAIFAVVMAVVGGGKNPPVTPGDDAPDSPGALVEPGGADDPPAATPPGDGDGEGDGNAEGSSPATANAPTTGERRDYADAGLYAIAPDGSTTATDGSTLAGVIGGLALDDDASTPPMEVAFDFTGAGVSRIEFANIWERAKATHMAERVVKGKDGATAPDPEERYVLVDGQLAGATDTVPELSAVEVIINDEQVSLLYVGGASPNGPVWGAMDSGAGEQIFATEIRDSTGTPIARITRSFKLGPTFDLELRQTVENLTDAPLDVQWWQYGPGDLRLDRARYIDRRRFRFGYVDLRDENHVLSKKKKPGLVERQSVLKQKTPVLWPNKISSREGFALSWFASTNRYFGLAMHPLLDEQEDGRLVGSLKAEPSIGLIRFSKTQNGKTSGPKAERWDIQTYVGSEKIAVAPGGSAQFNYGIFAGPLDRDMLFDTPVYERLGMHNLILYQMSSFCAICTFQWLAVLLLGFLNFLHDSVLFDWGLAIVCLVLVVRALLHPLTKRSQIGMQRMSRAMQAVKPEIDKLKKKYPDDPKRVQTEQMRLMREHGANPLAMLGCAPMFLQMPIWVALYATLYFAFDLRHEAAFFGLFQQITGGAWPFLADLSSADHFFGEFDEPYRFLFWNITGINLLPILMGAMFFLQQKYMTPPPSPSMSPEQVTQQKMIRVMMIVVMPLFLYSAPSGLTLYILTSSTIGILEGRYVRKHVDELLAKGNDPSKPKKPGFMARLQAMAEAQQAMKEAQKNGGAPPAGGKKGGKRDPQAKAYADAVERRKRKQEAKQRSSKRFKKRK